jgi:hypothetical protein
VTKPDGVEEKGYSLVHIGEKQVDNKNQELIRPSRCDLAILLLGFAIVIREYPIDAQRKVNRSLNRSGVFVQVSSGLRLDEKTPCGEFVDEVKEENAGRKERDGSQNSNRSQSVAQIRS